MKKTAIATIALTALLGSGPVSAQDWDDSEEDDLFGEEAEPAEEESMPVESEAQVETEAAVGADTGLGIGVGIANTLAGVSGAGLEFYVGDKLMINGLLGYQSFSPEGDMAETASILAIAAGGFYRLAGDARTALFVGGRLDIGFASEGATGTGESSTQFNLEVPARVQFYLSRALAFHLEAGLVVGFIGENGPALPPFGPADGTTITLGGQVFGSGGITLYLP